MKALAFNMLLALGLFLFITPVSAEQLDPEVTDQHIAAVELKLGSDGGYVWDGHTYQLSDLLPALIAQSKLAPFTQINLGASADITFQNIIDMATLARELSVDAYYQDGGELKRIDINE